MLSLVLEDLSVLRYFSTVAVIVINLLPELPQNKNNLANPGGLDQGAK